MPKTTVDGGPSYAGHVDVSSPDTVGPEWAPAPEVEPVVETQPEPEPVVEKPAPRARRKS